MGRSTPQRDESEEAAVFRALYPSLRRFAAVVGDGDMDPDDLVQEALLSTLRLHSLAELDSPRAYLRRAIVNGVANERRRLGRARDATSRIASGLENPADVYPSDLAVLDHLAPLDRAVVYLADVDGTPLVAIADELGLSVLAVRHRVSRGRRKVRKLIERDRSETAHVVAVVGTCERRERES